VELAVTPERENLHGFGGKSEKGGGLQKDKEEAIGETKKAAAREKI